MRLRRLCVALSLAALLALAPAASAHRPASRAEKAAMLYGSSGRYWNGLTVAEPRSVPLRCFVADIATVRRGSRWAAWSYSVYAKNHLRRCRAGNGFVIAHKIGRRWYVLWEGSGGYPPTHGRYGTKGVPRAIAKDLVSGLSEYGQPLH